MHSYDFIMSVTNEQIRDVVLASMQQAGCEGAEVTEGTDTDRVYCASIGHRHTASRILRQKLRKLGLEVDEETEVVDRVIFVNLTQSSDQPAEYPWTLLRPPDSPPGGHKYVPWSHVSLSKTVEAIAAKIQRTAATTDQVVDAGTE